MPRKKNRANGPPSEPRKNLRQLPKYAQEAFAPFFPDGLTVRDEANAIVAFAFRNGPIEDLHAGKHSKLVEDSSLSRITNVEMKTLMLDACQKMEELLRLKDANPDEYYTFIASYNWRYCRRWEK